MKQVNQNQLVNLLAGLTPNTPAKITTLTDPKLKKTGNPYNEGQIMKASVATVLLNYSYEKEVNRGRALEGKEFDFEAKPRKWGERFGNTPLITHNGQLYLSCKFLNTESTKYLNEGTEIDKLSIEQWLPVSKSAADKQGLDEAHEIIVRDFKIASITEIEVNGETYKIS